MELELTTQTQNVPYCDYFIPQQRWNITATGEGGCTVIVKAGVNFVKKTWLQGKIEGDAMKGMKESAEIWKDMVEKYTPGQAMPVAAATKEGGGGVGGATAGTSGKGEPEVQSFSASLLSLARKFRASHLLLSVLLVLYVLLFIRMSMLSSRMTLVEQRCLQLDGSDSVMEVEEETAIAVQNDTILSSDVGPE